MKSRCIIIDDELLARNGLEDFILKTPFLEHLKSLSSALKAIEFLKENTVDIMFLDIQMPDMTGIELMNALSNPPKVIFTTAHREFALDGFDLNAVDFLLKPISYSRFLKAVDKAIAKDNIESTDSKDHIFIKCDGMLIKIPIDDIVYIETAKDYIFVHTLHEKYLTLVSLQHIEEELPKSKFMRIHRSYLVGIRHVKKLEGNLLYIGDNKIKISRNLRNDVYERIIGNRLIERK